MPQPLQPLHAPADADWQLARAAATGDEEARTQFWNRHVRAVHLWLWFRWRHSSLRGFVDDATQEVFLECFRPGGALAHLEVDKAAHGVVAFLRGVVRNVAHRLERTQQRQLAHRRQLREAMPMQPANGDDAAERIDTAWQHGQVAAALSRLDREEAGASPHSLRAFLKAHFEDGLPVHTIAAAWQMKPEHVHELRRRACRRFRDCLLRVMREDRHGASHPVPIGSPPGPGSQRRQRRR